MSSPRTLHISNTGSDQDSGTVTAPFRTLSHEVSQLRAGDTLYIRDGTYTGSTNVIDSQTFTVPSGTSWSNAVTIAGYPGESVTIRPPDNVSGIRLTTGAPTYLIFRDFTIDMANSGANADATGIYLRDAHHNRFQGLEVKNSQSFNIMFDKTSGFNEVLGCLIHGTRLVGVDGLNGHGLYISSGDNLFEGNDIYDNQGYGLHLYNNAGPFNVSRNIIRNNKFHNNGRSGNIAYGLVIAWGDANLVDNNQIYGNPGGIQVYTNSSNTVVQNNTVFDNAPLEGILVQYATGTVLKDNIMRSNARDILDLGTGTVLSNNQ